MKYNFDCVVIGAGIAGMTAAIYLKRSNVNVLIIDNGVPGGLLNKITSIENYPGFTNISGPELAYSIYEQVKNLGIEIRYGQVLEINSHTIKTDIEEIATKKIIIATGRNAKKLANTNNLRNVSYCALCDGSLYKEKTIALVGNGNSALEEALYLSDLCKEVIMILRSESLKGEDISIEKINSRKNIKILNNSVINTLNSDNNILKEIVTNNGTFSVDGMFISIGYEPNNDFLKEINTEKGYVLVNNKMQTNIDYIYACGDIIKKDIYQLATAVGEAATAAINVKKDLNRD